MDNASVVMHVVMANKKDSGSVHRAKTPTDAYSVDLRDDVGAVKSTTILAIKVLILTASKNNMLMLLTVHPIFPTHGLVCASSYRGLPDLSIAFMSSPHECSHCFFSTTELLAPCTAPADVVQASGHNAPVAEGSRRSSFRSHRLADDHPGLFGLLGK